MRLLLIQIFLGIVFIGLILSIITYWYFPEWFAQTAALWKERIAKLFARRHVQPEAEAEAEATEPEKAPEENPHVPEINTVPFGQLVGLGAKYVFILSIVVYAPLFVSDETLNLIGAGLGHLALGTLVFFVTLFILPFIPGLVKGLTNDPNFYKPENWNGTDYYPPSTFGFFTMIEPGRVKIIERGERFVKAIMSYSEHKFLGEKPDNDLTPDKIDYTEICRSEPYADSDPIPFPGFKPPSWWFLYSEVSVFWWLWKRHVYFITGAVFTGIMGFQGVRVYRIEYFRKHKNEKTGEITLEKVINWSDHYRAAQFEMCVIIEAAETSDLLPLRIMLDLVVRCSNPYLTAYNTNNNQWTMRFVSAVVDAVNNFTRSRPHYEVVAIGETTRAHELENAVKEVGKRWQKGDTKKSRLAEFGLFIDQVQILDIGINDEKVASQLRDKAIAFVDKEAMKTRAEGRKEALILEGQGQASQIEAAGTALKANPEGRILINADRDVRVAQAIKEGGLAIIGGGGGNSSDATNVAILQELKRLNRQGART